MDQNKENLTQEEIWDKISILWSKYKKKQYDDLKEFLEDKQGKILDLGCGSGRNFIKKPSLDFYGVDFSKKQLEHAEERAKEMGISIETKKASVESLPFKDNFFDSAIYIAALHCVETKGARENSLKELFRTLKPGAKVMITVWSKNHRKVKKYLEKFSSKDTKIPWKREGVKYLRYYYIYDKDELENLVRKLGFEIIKSKEDNNIVLILKKPKN